MATQNRIYIRQVSKFNRYFLLLGSKHICDAAFRQGLIVDFDRPFTTQIHQLQLGKETIIIIIIIVNMPDKHNRPFFCQPNATDESLCIFSIKIE